MDSSSKTLKFWNKFISNCYRTRLIPYHWESDTNCPNLNSVKRRRAYIIQFLLILAYQAFLLCRAVQVLRNENELFRKKIKLLFSIVVYGVLNVNQ